VTQLKRKDETDAVAAPTHASAQKVLAIGRRR
jgi:hypothetical protein